MRLPIRKDWQIIKNLRRPKERYGAMLDILSWCVPFLAVYGSIFSFLALCIILLQIKSVTEPDENFDLIWSTIITLFIALSYGFIIYMRWDGSFAIIMCTAVPIFALGLLICRLVRRHVVVC